MGCFSALGFKNIGFGSGGGKRDIQFERENKPFNIENFNNEKEEGEEWKN